MKTGTATVSAEVDIWAKLIHPEGEMSRETARRILTLAFSPQEKARMRELSAKARKGTLTESETCEIDGFERAGSLLSILKSKARRILGVRPRR